MPGISSNRMTNQTGRGCGAGLSMGIGNKSNGTNTNRASNSTKAKDGVCSLKFCCAGRVGTVKVRR
tara:strand:- start:365 stop:562 length:198 start_codon:yes stop_codon:yes gene_type:complete